jgi:hypothetical protein
MTYEVKEFFWQLVDHWQTLITGFLALGAGIGTIWVTIISAKRQISAAHEQTKAAQESSRAQLRAYVLTSRSVVRNIDGTGMPEAHVTIKNSGQTPAYHVISVSGFAIDRYPSPPTLNLVISDREFSNPSLSREVLGPGDTSISAVPAARLLTAPERASLADGTGIVYAYGEIRYRDAFGRKQCTKYRYMMGGPVGIRGDQMAACEEGNEAT